MASKELESVQGSECRHKVYNDTDSKGNQRKGEFVHRISKSKKVPSFDTEN
uniref:SET domain protein n=1 Tax=Solanum tuberosum TaxID=4113 RepID=M1BVI3_SOLTU